MKVPTYDNLTATPNTVSAQPFQEQNGPGAGQVAGDQLQNLGVATQRAGDAGARIAMSMQDEVNQVKVNDAVNQARRAAQNLAYDPSTGYLNLKGDAALTRPDGQALPEEYGNKLKTSLSEIAGALGNDIQRQQFQRNANDLQTQFQGQVQTHMLGEFRSHALSVQDGTIDLASDDAKRNWNNPDLIAPSLEAAKAAVIQKGRVSGWSASQTDAALLTTSSKVHAEVVMSALENGNSSYAMTYLDSRKGQMTADDILRVQGHVDKQMWLGAAQTAVQAATTQSKPQIIPNDLDRMTQITLSSESGGAGHDFGKDGKVLTSSAGAMGRMQVLSSTNTDPGFGVRPAANDSLDERARVGRDYLSAMVQRYGSADKAWAAYNAGPDRLDKAMAAAVKDSQPDAWLSKLPAETQAYVQKNVSQLQSNGGVPPRPTELDFVNRAVAALPPGARPEIVSLTRTQAAAQFAMIDKQLTAQGTAAVGDAQRWLAQNNGDYASMPAKLRDTVSQLAPDKSDDLIKYAEVFSKVKEPTTDLVTYNRMASHPDELGKLSDTEFEQLRTRLSPADFKHFSNERQDYLSGKTSDTTGSLNMSAVNASLKPLLESLGIDTAPKHGDDKGAARLGGINKYVRDSLFDAQQAAGRKFTPDEVDKSITKLFSKDVTFRNTFMGISTGTTTTNLMQLQVKDIPSESAQALRESFSRRGKTNPTDTDMINAYRTWKMGAK